MRRTARSLVVVAIAFLALIALPAAALAEGETIKGTLEKIDGDVREPVAGVTITVELDGTTIGTAESDENGDWEIPVPSAGTYLVRLEVDTLPDGVALTDPERSELPNVSVRNDQNKTARFNLGPGLESGVSTWTRVSSLFVVGLKFGAIIALASIGLSLIFGVTGLVNFAHGDLVTLGAVIAYWFNAAAGGPGWHILLAAVPALLLVAAFGGAQEHWLWRPLRVRGTGLVPMIVVSIGLSFVIRYLILVVFSGLPRPYMDYAIQNDIQFLGITTVPKNLAIIVFTALVLLAVGLFLTKTRLGTAMRAVADNADLAESSGIDVQRVIRVTWIVGAGLAGLGGVMFGISEQVQWDMGFKLLLLIFAAVILGGLGTAFGAMLGGFLVGVAVEMSTLWIAVEFKTAVALGILIAMLLIRPQGLLGVKERIG
ncbi:MAG: branched-chain amino acid ABC transporter permease [Acidimicrobiia bacterium]|nr:branched-chain amino acid ABC transporter permease [Acidimicrobiia bacterium]